MVKRKIYAFAVIVCLCNYYYLFANVFCGFVDINAVQKNFTVTPTNYKNIRANTTYKLTWVKFTSYSSSSSGSASSSSASQSSDDNSSSLVRELFFMSLPPRLRLMQLNGNSKNAKLEYSVSKGNASVIIKRVTRLHNGPYSAFKVIYDTVNNTSFVEQRKDFYVNVTGLERQDGFCQEDSDCYSNKCQRSRCLCGEHSPVAVQGKCFTAKPIGHSCNNSNQCKFWSGNSAECSQHGLCRCSRNAFTVTLPFIGKYCLRPKKISENCTYSEQCRALGVNRYCTENYRCECIPGYAYTYGKGCRSSSSAHNNNTSITITRNPSSLIYYLLLIILIVR